MYVIMGGTGHVGSAVADALREDELALSLASVMGPPRCHEHGTTWRCR